MSVCMYNASIFEYFDQWHQQGGARGGSRPPNDFLNRLLDSSKFDSKEPWAGMGGGGGLKFSNNYLHGLFRLVITEKYQSYI